MTLKLGLDVTEFDIHPGVPMGGYAGRSKPCSGVHDPLHAKTMALNLDGEWAIISSCELVGLEKKRILAVKKAIFSEFKIPPENILISAIHTHSGPRNIALFGEPYAGFENLYEDIIHSIKNAINSLNTVSLGVGTTLIDDATFNRRVYDQSSEHVDRACKCLVFRDGESRVTCV
ncbi:MAG: neutral/alkaline non-lysosomal ceramidase N-terminal domain-containing protein, partial [Promethearchaeota archaeon]